MSFATILADPDWSYENFGQAKHGAARAHYAGSGTEYMAGIPVERWARKSTTLFLWATNPKLDCAIDVMRAWGFSLVTSVPWVKTTPSKAELAKGVGHWFYGTSEILLVCRRKNAKAPAYKSGSDKPDGLLVGEKGDCVFYARRGPHSRKPLSLIEWIEAYLPGPLLELYARDTRKGWTTWGKDTGYWLVPRQIDSRGVLPIAEARDLGLVHKEDA